ncbi:hypothetical protein HHK36_016883 [Tetracentron sinense]|uniref:Transcription repressor n=1 Tax=Tetracentron sinense TaxID=13715 RepID=A0A834Z6M5_TETSI|nr:hypothetical protein HHK36_016883 [Tetracentron sinense]
MSTTQRKKLLGKAVTVKIGCSCRRLKLSDIFRPSPKPKSSSYQKPDLYRSSSSSWDRRGISSIDHTTTTSSPTTGTSPQYDTKTSSKTVRGYGRVGESIAVVKDSEDPYLDFRNSMLQMILENDIYSRDDLRELLNCFLQLNSPSHYDIIVQAFTEIWNGVFSVRHCFFMIIDMLANEVIKMGYDHTQS